MIYFKTEEECLNYLMTSDFNEQLSPEDLKSILKKFRYFYRLSESKQKTLLYQIDSLVHDINVSETIRKDSAIESSILIDKYKDIMSRRMTFKERVLGRVIEKPFYRKFRIFDILNIFKRKNKSK